MIRSVHMRSGLAVVVAAGIVALSGCPTTRQTRSVEKSGFLGDYSQLREGGMGEAQLVYIKSGVPWARYSKMEIDPVTIWTSGDSDVASGPTCRTPWTTGPTSCGRGSPSFARGPESIQGSRLT
ncbi:MAG: DUF3313 domain-containing protein [Deltaproteobacteria bacterium]|nr:MAG: DUF3313 domain-containing protein [Deltaproteobacteria bacterium]